MQISSKLAKTIFFTITLLVGGALFISLIEKVGLVNIINAIFTFKLRHFVFLISLSMLSAIISTWRWKIILDASGNRTSFKNVFIARMIGGSINYLTPSGLVLGEPLKAVVLSGKTNLSLGSTMASIIIEGSIFLSTSLLFVIIGIFAFLSYSAVSSNMLVIVMGALIFLLSMFYLFYSKMVRSSCKKEEKGLFTYLIDLLYLHKISFINNLKARITRRENEIKIFFQLHRKTVFTAIFLSILELVITLLSSWLTLYFLGIKVGLKPLLGLFSLMNISYLIPLPGALGGLELSQVFAFDFFNLGGQTIALAFALITRLVSLTIVSIGIGYLIHFQLNIISAKAAEYSIDFKQKIRDFLRSL